MSQRKPWERREDETPVAYAAFEKYHLLPPNERSIDNVYRASTDHQVGSEKRAPRRWFTWSVDYSWVERAKAYDDHLAEQNRQLWEHRRAELLRRDWEQADALRAIVDEAIPHAQQFIRRKTTRIPGTPARVDTDGKVISAGTPDREIVTLEFRIVDLASVTEKASKLQRLVVDEPTEATRVSIDDGDDERQQLLSRIAIIENRLRADSDPGRDSTDGKGQGASKL